MVLEDIRAIKSKRKKADLTQKKLAREAGVSQSLIAKLESGKAEASYTKVKRILEAIDKANKKEEKKAEDVMSKSIVKASPDEKIKEVTAKMKKYEISQLPVFSGSKQVGSITETAIITKMEENKDIHNKLVKDIMGDPLPTVSKETSISSLLPLLKEIGAVLIMDKGRLAGIVTKADVI